MEPSLGRRVMWVIWPAFLVAGVGEAIFFTLFDPIELRFFGAPIEVSREAAYTLGFFAFWVLAMTSSVLTVLLGRSAAEVNRCPLDAPDRPPGCPKRADPEDQYCCADVDASRP